jgi:hypothetical protein
MAALDYGSLKSEYDGFKEPLAVIRVNDSRISDSKKDFVIGDVNVDLTSGFEAAMATFCIYNCFDLKSREFKVSDLKKYICLGSEVTISLGYAEVVKTVFTGFISKVNYIYDKDDIPHVMITCMDAKAVMMANSYCSQLISKNYSDAINEILQRPSYVKLQNMGVINTVSVSATPDKSAVSASGDSDTGITMEMVNESDYEFIVRAAKRFNYEFFTDCGNLIFRKAKSGASVQLKLDSDCDIYSLDVQYDCVGIAGTVVVRGTDINKAKLIETKEKNNNKFSIGNYARQLVKNNQKTYVDATIQSQSDADYRAAYLMEDISYRFGTLECECIGIPDLKPGDYIEVSGMGEGVSNKFYVTNIVHIFVQDEGYKTRIIGKTNTIQ